MKKLLIAALALGTMSAFAAEPSLSCHIIVTENGKEAETDWLTIPLNKEDKGSYHLEYNRKTKNKRYDITVVAGINDLIGKGINIQLYDNKKQVQMGSNLDERTNSLEATDGEHIWDRSTNGILVSCEIEGI